MAGSKFVILILMEISKMNNRLRSRRRRVVLPLLMAFGLLAGGLALAIKSIGAAGLELQISPPLLEVMIKPGHSLTQSFIVANATQRPVYLRARMVRFVPVGKQGQARPRLEPVYFGPWRDRGVEFSLVNADRRLGEVFLLAPGAKQQLVLRIQAALSAADRDGYYTLLVEQAPQGRFLPGNGSQARLMIGSNILLTVSRSGRPLKKLAISRFRARPWLVDWGQVLRLRLIVANQGKSFSKAIGKIEVSAWGGLWRRQLQLRPDNILVHSQRELNCWQQHSTAAAKLAGKTVPCQIKPWLPGYYQAKVQLAADGGGATASAKLHFLVFPWRELLGLIALAAIGYGVSKQQTTDNRPRTTN